MTIKLTIEFKKSPGFMAQFKGGSSISGEARSIMRGWSGRVNSKVSRYPSQVGTYRRTGALGKGFKDSVDIGADTITARVENAVPYATYVVGDRQRGFHKSHGWNNIDDVAKTEWKVTVDRLRKLFEGK